MHEEQEEKTKFLQSEIAKLRMQLDTDSKKTVSNPSKVARDFAVQTASSPTVNVNACMPSFMNAMLPVSSAMHSSSSSSISFLLPCPQTSKPTFPDPVPSTVPRFDLEGGATWKLVEEAPDRGVDLLSAIPEFPVVQGVDKRLQQISVDPITTNPVAPNPLESGGSVVQQAIVRGLFPPKFTGEEEDWGIFMKKWREYIHNLSPLTPVSNEELLILFIWHYLQT